MTNLDSILKSRDITLSTKVCLVKAVVFPMVMYGYESWTIKKAECQRIDAYELWCWRRLLRVPWTARRSNQSILKEISPGISLEGMMLKLKQVANTLENWLIGKDLGAGKDWGQENRQQRTRWLDGTPAQRTRVWAKQEMVKDREAWRAAVHGIPMSQTGFSDWTTMTIQISWWQVWKNKIRCVERFHKLVKGIWARIHFIKMWRSTLSWINLASLSYYQNQFWLI